MTRILVTLAFLSLGFSVMSQAFNRYREYLMSLPDSLRQEKVDSLTYSEKRFPWIDGDSTCTFLYAGTARSVSVAGDMTSWREGRIVMENIPGTTLWYASKRFEPDARIDYKIVVDHKNWMIDPRNPDTCMSGYGPNSELRMPDYQLPPEALYDPAVPQGVLKDTVVTSETMGNSRRVRIYLPAGYQREAGPWPVAVFQDGLEFIPLSHAVIILDNLIAEKKIKPLVGVFIEPVEREAEYAGDLMDAYVAFLSDDLMPHLTTRFELSPDPDQCATIGISNGGNISLYLGIRRPDRFGKVAALSSNVSSRIGKAFFKSSPAGLEFYLDMGTYDIPELIPLTDQFTRMLERSGYPFTYYKWHEGHSWGNWKGHLGLALKQFFAY